MEVNYFHALSVLKMISVLFSCNFLKTDIFFKYFSLFVLALNHQVIILWELSLLSVLLFFLSFIKIILLNLLMYQRLLLLHNIRIRSDFISYSRHDLIPSYKRNESNKLLHEFLYEIQSNKMKRFMYK